MEENTIDFNNTGSSLLRDNSRRRRNLLAILYINGVFCLLGILHSLHQNKLLNTVLDGEYNDADLELSDTMGIVIGLSAVAVGITSVVLFIMWFRRAYYNLHQIPNALLSFEEGWAAGSWFVPFLNLGRPYRIMKDIWKETFRLNSAEGTGDRPASLIGIWWTFWLISNFLNNIAMRASMNAEDIDSLMDANNMDVYSGVFTMVALVLVIVIIRNMAEEEDKLFTGKSEKDIMDHLIVN